MGHDAISSLAFIVGTASVFPKDALEATQKVAENSHRNARDKSKPDESADQRGWRGPAGM